MTMSRLLVSESCDFSENINNDNSDSHPHHEHILNDHCSPPFIFDILYAMHGYGILMEQAHGWAVCDGTI